MAVPCAALFDLAEVFSGHTLRPGQLWVQGANVRTVQAVDLDERRALACTLALPPALIQGRSSSNLLRGGDILLRTRGGSNQAVLITEALTPTVAVSPLLVLRVRGGVELAPQYLHWLLNSPAMQEQLDREARGTTIRMISAASVRQLSVPVPPLARQVQIARLAMLAMQEEELTRQLQAQRHQLLEQVLWHSAQNAGGIPPPGKKGEGPGRYELPGPS